MKKIACKQITLFYGLVVAIALLCSMGGNAQDKNSESNPTKRQTAVWQYPVLPYSPIYANRTFYCCTSSGNGGHLGEDIQKVQGTPINAIGPGTIKLYRAASSGYGELYVVVEHDLGSVFTFTNAYGQTVNTRYIISIYGHLRKSQVRGGPETGLAVGSQVDSSTIIGYVNNSSHPDGGSPDPNGDGLEHLHLGIRLSTWAEANRIDTYPARGYENNSDMGKYFAKASDVISTLINAQPYDGSHDENNCERIFGWAWDRTNPGSRVNVEIYDGNTLLGTATANQFRQDLRDLGIGDGSGNYAFNFNTPASIKNGQPHTIRIKVSGTDFFFLNTARVFNSVCGATPNARIRLEGGGQNGGNNSVINYVVQTGQKIKVTFDGATSQAANTALRTWNWTRRVLGFPRPDGSLSINEVVTTSNLTRFDEDLGVGTHTVNLEVIDAAGLRNMATATIVVSETTAAAPTAVISMSGGSQSGTNGQTLYYTVPTGGSINMNFNASGSQPGTGGSITGYEWRSNGTIISNSSSLTFPFAAASHTISLKVTNSSGLTKTATATIVVTEGTAGAPVSIISMSSGGQTGGNGQTLNYQVSPGGSITMNLNGGGSQSGSGSITSYEWRSNGTVISNLPNFTFPFAAASHSITLTVTNSAGQLNTASATIVVTTSTGSTPTVGGIVTSPNPPITGQAFNFTISGSNFLSNSEVFFQGPGCSTSTACVVSGLNRTATQLSGAAVLASGSYTVQVRNGLSGSPSNSVSLNVSNTQPVPVIDQLSTSPNPPINGQAFVITLTGSNFSTTNSTIFFSGPGCNSPCSISASGSNTQVSGQAILATGSFTVTVRNNVTGLTSSGRTLTVSSGTPVINQLSTSPNPPIPGQAFTITLTGSNFSGTSSTIFFSGPGCSTPCSINATGSATQVSGQAILAAGSFTVTVRNNTTGLTSSGVTLTISNPNPVINQLNTSPNPPINGQTFTITLTGSNFSGTSSTIFFSGPGCSTPCSINATGSSTQVSGQAVLATGTFTVTVRNNSTGLTSTGVSLTVNSGVPSISSMTTSPNPPVNGQAFNFTINGSGFNTSNSEVYFIGPGCSTSTSCVVSGLNRTTTRLTGAAVLAAGTFTVRVRNGSSGTPSNSVTLVVN